MKALPVAQSAVGVAALVMADLLYALPRIAKMIVPVLLMVVVVPAASVTLLRHIVTGTRVSASIAGLLSRKGKGDGCERRAGQGVTERPVRT